VKPELEVCALAAGRAGTAFALTLRTADRNVLAWASLAERTVAAWTATRPDLLLAIIDAAPARLLLAAYRDAPMTGVDASGRQVWSWNDLRQVSSVAPLGAGRRVVARFRAGDARLIDADTGKWRVRVPSALIGGTEEHPVVLSDRRGQSLGIGAASRRLLPAVDAAHHAAVGHGLVVIGGRGLGAFRLDDGKPAWSIAAATGWWCNDVIATPSGFRVRVGVDGANPHVLDLDVEGRGERGPTLPYAAFTQLLGPSLVVTSGGLVLDGRSQEIVWDFGEALRSAARAATAPPGPPEEPSRRRR
jgi:hypothetical protein